MSDERLPASRPFRDPFGEPHVIVRLDGFSRYWTAVAADGPNAIAHIWGDQKGAARFSTAMDATMVARLVRRDGIVCEVVAVSALIEETHVRQSAQQS